MSLAEQAACWIDKNVIRCVEISERNTKPPGDCASADDIERALHKHLTAAGHFGGVRAS